MDGIFATQIFPTMLGVLLANILTLSAVYGFVRLAKIKSDASAPGDVAAAWCLPLIFLALGLLVYGGF